MERIEITKAEAERQIQLWEEAEAKGWKVHGFSIGDGKYYAKEFLEDAIENEGVVIQKLPVLEHHAVVVPESSLCMGMSVKSSNKG